MDNETQKAFLLELYRRTRADTGAQQSMYAVGATIGLDKPEAKRTAEDLIGMGLVEIRTLSGGVGITEEGITAARPEDAGYTDDYRFSLGNAPIIDDRDRQAVISFTGVLRQRIEKTNRSYADLEEMVIDIKTLEVHLLSSRPKTAVVRELLRSLQSAFEKTGDGETAGRINRVIN